MSGLGCKFPVGSLFITAVGEEDELRVFELPAVVEE
jgi:hypothetical protein